MNVNEILRKVEPLREIGVYYGGDGELHKEIINLINNLRNENESPRENMNFVLDYLHGICSSCKNYSEYHRVGSCKNCKYDHANFDRYSNELSDNWEWKGSFNNENGKRNKS